MKLSLSLLSLFAALMLSSCTRPLEELSDNELADRSYDCRTATEQSPGYAIRCDNYQRECEHRREEGRYVC